MTLVVNLNAGLKLRKSATHPFAPNFAKRECFHSSVRALSSQITPPTRAVEGLQQPIVVHPATSRLTRVAELYGSLRAMQSTLVG